MESQLTKGILYTVLIIVIIIWALIGFLFWIPILTRTIAIYCLNLVYTMIAKKPEAYTARLQKSLDYAMVFYILGFKRIILVMFHTASEQEPSGSSAADDDGLFDDVNWFSLLGELAWTMLFWGLVLLPIIFAF